LHAIWGERPVSAQRVAEQALVRLYVSVRPPNHRFPWLLQRTINVIETSGLNRKEILLAWPAPLESNSAFAGGLPFSIQIGIGTYTPLVMSRDA